MRTRHKRDKTGQGHGYLTGVITKFSDSMIFKYFNDLIRLFDDFDLMLLQDLEANLMFEFESEFITRPKK